MDKVAVVVVVVFALNVHTKYVDRPSCVTIFSICMIEASKVDHSANYVAGWWWLPAAAFVSAARTLHLGAFDAGGTLSEWPPSIRKYFVRSVREKGTRFETFGGL